MSKLNRRKAKKAFKQKWRNRIRLLKTVPKGISPREADRINAIAEKDITEAIAKAMEDAVLYGFRREPPEELPDGLWPRLIENTAGNS